MNLVIDVGNTAIKLAVFKAHTLVSLERTNQSHFLKSISDIFAQYPDIQYSILSSVGQTDPCLVKAVQVFSQLHLLSHQSKVPFVNRYTTPHTLGVDRLALMAAAYHHHYGKNVLVIDAGTCITYDLLTESSDYLGGAISPGLQMRFKALHHFTAKLPLEEADENFSVPGNSTASSIKAGVVDGIVHEIDGFIDFYAKNHPHLTVILTGGDGVFLSKRLKNTIFAHSNFLLEGLNYILELNKH